MDEPTKVLNAAGTVSTVTPQPVSEAVPPQAHPAGNGPLVMEGRAAALPAMGSEVAVDPVGLLKAFQRRWPLALVAGLVCGAAAAVLAWFAIPQAKYVSRAALKVNSYVPRIIFQTAEVMPETSTFKNTQVALIKSRLILDDTLRTPEINRLSTIQDKRHSGGDPVEWLEKELQVGFLAGSDILQISLMGYSQGDLPKIVNRVVDLYLEKVVQVDQRNRQTRLEDLRKLWTRYQDELKAKRKSLRELAQATGSTDTESLALRQQYAVENLALAQRERMGIASEIKRAEAELKVLGDRVPAIRPSATVTGAATGPSSARSMADEMLANDDVLADLQQRAAELDGEIGYLQRLSRSPSDPALIKAKQGLAATQRSIKQRQSQLWSQAQTGLANGGVPARLVGATTPDSFAALRERLAVLKVYDDALAKDVARFEEEARSTTLNTLDLQTEQDEVELASTTAQKVGSEVEALEVELNAPPRVEVIDRAVPPMTKDDSKRPKMAAIAGLGSFALALFGITFMEYRSRRIGSANQVSRDLGIRLVGALPDLPDTSSRRRRLLYGSRRNELNRSMLVESVDATRTLLLHASRTQAIRSVLITSAMKGEGKTSLTSQLATSLARAGLKTLLIDCDMRRPALNRLFDIPQDPGLCDLLRGEIEPRDAIHATVVENLSLIAAGHCDPLALRILAQNGLSTLLDRLYPGFDYVVVDSAPVLPVADTLVISQQVDAVIFSILRDVSRVPQVQTAHDQLAALGARILGAVVNGEKTPGYGYKGYYVYG